MIGRFFSWLWSLARLFPTAIPGVRFGGGASVLLTFLFLVFFIAGLMLVGFGFDLDEVDVWLDRHADLFGLIGTILFKGLLLGVLAICLLVVSSPVIDRSNKDRPGGCMILIAIAIGYLCIVGIFFN